MRKKWLALAAAPIVTAIVVHPAVLAVLSRPDPFGGRRFGH